MSSIGLCAQDINHVHSAPGKTIGDDFHDIQHTDDGHSMCSKCHMTGSDLKSKSCSGKPNPDKPIELGKPADQDDLDSVLQLLLQEEVELSSLLEESLSLSKMQPPATEPVEDEDHDLQSAIALSMQALPETMGDQDRPVGKQETMADDQPLGETMADPDQPMGKPVETEGEPDIAEAIQLSLEELPRKGSTSGLSVHSSPAAGDEKDNFSEKDLYNMQSIINMGYTRAQAIWGVKWSNEGNGSIDLALMHASWKCDADILMDKRKRLHLLVQKSRPQCILTN